MNYLEYFDELINEFQHKKADAQKMYEVLIQSKDYLDSSKTSDYFSQVNKCHAVADLAESIIKDILAGAVLPFDPID